MPIFDQGYQHWRGTLSGHAWRWLAITRHGARMQWKNKATRRAVVAALLPALVLAGFLVLWGLFEQQSSLLEPLLFLLRGLPEELRAGARSYRVPVWTFAFSFFFEVQMFFSMILVLLVGPDLISQDLRSNAMPLYFSRPLRRADYFLGKLGVIAVYLSAVTIVPVLLAYVLGVGFSLDLGVVRDTARLLGASLAYGLVVVVSAGTLMLAISSLSKNSRLVGGMWMAIWIIGGMAADALARTAQVEWAPLVSFVRDLGRIREALLDVSSAWEAMSGIIAFTGRGATNPYLDRYPWQWSAAVLAAVSGLSLCILSLRVRSLDRLR